MASGGQGSLTAAVLSFSLAVSQLQSTLQFSRAVMRFVSSLFKSHAVLCCAAAARLLHPGDVASFSRCRTPHPTKMDRSSQPSRCVGTPSSNPPPASPICTILRYTHSTSLNRTRLKRVIYNSYIVERLYIYTSAPLFTRSCLYPSLFRHP